MRTECDSDFLNELQLEYGPVNMLGQFFLKAYQDLKDRGVTLSFASFEELMAINEMNLKSWRPLTSVFSLGKGGISNENGICIIGRDAEGSVVATQAIRLFDWQTTNFRTEAESLRLFYADPDRSKALEETCSVSAPSAERISGRVAYGGAIWCRPDFRSGMLSAVMPRIGRVYAYSKWKTDYIVAIMAENTVQTGFVQRIGYRKVEWAVRRINPPNFAAETTDLRLALAFADQDDLIDDVFSFMLSTETQVDRRVEERRA